MQNPTQNPLFSILDTGDDDVRNKLIFLLNNKDEVVNIIIMIPNNKALDYYIKKYDVRPSSGNTTATKVNIFYGREIISETDLNTILTGILTPAEIASLLTL